MAEILRMRITMCSSVPFQLQSQAQYQVLFAARKLMNFSTGPPFLNRGTCTVCVLPSRKDNWPNKRPVTVTMLS